MSCLCKLKKLMSVCYVFFWMGEVAPFLLQLSVVLGKAAALITPDTVVCSSFKQHRHVWLFSFTLRVLMTPRVAIMVSC